MSTDDQDLALQLDALERAGCVSIYEESAQGSGFRPKLEYALRALRAGDTLTVWGLDRLGRSLVNLVELIDGLRKRGVTFNRYKKKLTPRPPPESSQFTSSPLWPNSSGT